MGRDEVSNGSVHRELVKRNNGAISSEKSVTRGVGNREYFKIMDVYMRYNQSHNVHTNIIYTRNPYFSYLKKKWRSLVKNRGTPVIVGLTLT